MRLGVFLAVILGIFAVGLCFKGLNMLQARVVVLENAGCVCEKESR